jgi:hypothetical protein
MLATDRDLLAMEPRLFHDVAWIGQRVHGGRGGWRSRAGGLEVVDPSGPFTPGRVEAGGVLLLDGLAVEVVSVADASTAGISLVRGAAEDPAIPAGSLGATARLEAFTFRPQLEIAHRQALALFGLADGAEADGELAPLASVIDTGGLRTLAAVGALGLVHASAAPIVDASGGRVREGGALPGVARGDRAVARRAGGRHGRRRGGPDAARDRRDAEEGVTMLWLSPTRVLLGGVELRDVSPGGGGDAGGAGGGVVVGPRAARGVRGRAGAADGGARGADALERRVGAGAARGRGGAVVPRGVLVGRGRGARRCRRAWWVRSVALRLDAARGPTQVIECVAGVGRRRRGSAGGGARLGRGGRVMASTFAGDGAVRLRAAPVRDGACGSARAGAGTGVRTRCRRRGDRARAELQVVQTGRLIGADEADLWAQVDAIQAEAELPRTGTLVDHHGRSWTGLTLLRFAPTGPVDRGRVASLGYEAVYRRLG